MQGDGAASGRSWAKQGEAGRTNQYKYCAFVVLKEPGYHSTSFCGGVKSGNFALESESVSVARRRRHRATGMAAFSAAQASASPFPVSRKRGLEIQAGITAGGSSKLKVKAFVIARCAVRALRVASAPVPGATRWIGCRDRRRFRNARIQEI